MGRLQASYDAYCLGMERRLAHDYQQAPPHFLRSQMLHPHYKTCIRITEMLTALNRESEAGPFIEQAYAQNPNHSQTGTEYARLLAARGQVDEAVEILRSVVNHNSTYGPAWTLLRSLQEPRAQTEP